jgi:hypothetical protein
MPLRLLYSMWIKGSCGVVVTESGYSRISSKLESGTKVWHQVCQIHADLPGPTPSASLVDADKRAAMKCTPCSKCVYLEPGALNANLSK